MECNKGKQLSAIEHIYQVNGVQISDINETLIKIMVSINENVEVTKFAYSGLEKYEK